MTETWSLPSLGHVPPEKCSGAEWHTKQKHALLWSYLRIWLEHVGQRPAFSSKRPSLQIADIHASFGFCYDEKTQETWPGTALLAAHCLKQYATDYPKRLFLNSFVPPDEETSAVQRGALEDAVGAIDLAKYRCTVEYRSLAAEEAIEEAQHFLDPRFPNIWLLDPYNPKDLPWVAVEAVARFTAEYAKDGQTVTRRPELFINLMTSTLQRTLDSQPMIMSTTIGLEEKAWRERLSAFQSRGLNTTDAILELYVSRLRENYDKDPVAVKIPATQGNVVYTLLFCTDSEPGYFMMRKEGLPEYQVWRNNEWVPAAEYLRARGLVDRKAAKVGQRQSDLGDFSSR